MVRFSILERDKLLLDYKGSGLKVSEFYRHRGVYVKTFGNWRRQFLDGIAPSRCRVEGAKARTVLSSQSGCDHTITSLVIFPLELHVATTQMPYRVMQEH